MSNESNYSALDEQRALRFVLAMLEREDLQEDQAVAVIDEVTSDSRGGGVAVWELVKVLAGGLAAEWAKGGRDVAIAGIRRALLDAAEIKGEG